MNNVFEGIPANSAEEIFTDILLRPGVRIERIISTGQATPENAPYDQDHDEWVLLLKGAAGPWIDGAGERTLRPGDHVLIPVRRLHRVRWTARDEPTLWLGVHFDGQYAVTSSSPSPSGRMNMPTALDRQRVV